jgi:hypothetical protein
MSAIVLKTQGFKEALAALGAVADNLPQEVYISLSKAAGKVRSELAKEINKELNVKRKEITENIKILKNRHLLSARVVLYKTSRIPLKRFGVKEKKGKGGGVESKISKKKGKKLYRPGFLIAKAGNHAFTRPNNGRKIAKLHGPSPWGVVIKSPDMIDNIVVVSDVLIKKEMAERVRYLTLKNAGKLNWQQKD